MRLLTRLDAPRYAAVGLAALLAGDAAYWILTAATWPELASFPPALNAVSDPAPIDGDVVGLLGGSTGAASDPGLADGRFQLRGVVSGSRIAGAAVITVDGHTKTYRVGDAVAEGWVLSAVSGAQATLSPATGDSANPRGGDALTLSVPRQHESAPAPVPARSVAAPSHATPEATPAVPPPRRRGPDTVPGNPKP